MNSISARLRRLYWGAEDKITDFLDWEPHHPAPPSPAPTKQQPQYVGCNFAGVGGRRLTAEQENDERLRSIFERLSRGQLIERF